ncbi:MAG: DUF2235 domain-containing protein [Acidobacteriota bacterium]
MKNIIICSDGTGNTAIKGRGTNVFKLFEAVDLNGHRSHPKLDPQIAIYDDGVGTETLKPLKLIGGAFGYGMKRNVLDLYKGLVRIYDPGDQIFLFGFSRGAFTVRTLADFIAKCGVLRWEETRTASGLQKEVNAAYEVYRESYRTTLWRILHRKSERDVEKDALALTSAFRAEHACHIAGIHFMGVWDTVDSVGGPFHLSDFVNGVVRRFKFPDYRLSATTKYAAQALSIDDARAAFVPRLWEEREGIEQVWFAGVHSNVGGGYPKQGMSLVALDWMLQQAEARGLRMLREDRVWCAAHANVDDKLYDSRSGAGVFYRWLPREMQALTISQNAGLRPNVHVSVLERIAHGTDGYAPGTLAPDIRVVFTPTGDPIRDAALRLRSEAVEKAANDYARQHGGKLKLPDTLKAGMAGYYGYVLSGVALILSGAVFYTPEGTRTSPLALVSSVWNLVSSTASMHWGALVTAILAIPGMLFWAIVDVVLLSIALALYAAGRRSTVFSSYWHDARQELRKALKSTREN